MTEEPPSLALIPLPLTLEQTVEKKRIELFKGLVHQDQGGILYDPPVRLTGKPLDNDIIIYSSSFNMMTIEKDGTTRMNYGDAQTS